MFGNKYILSAVLACIPFATQAAETVYTFDSVAAVENTANEILLTGILVNDTVPTTVTLPWGNNGWQYDRCEKIFNLVLSQPATYTLTVATELKTAAGGPPGQPPTQYVVFNRCRVELKP